MALAGTMRSMRSRITSSRPLMTWITYHTSTTPLLSYVWLTGFGYGFARALMREGAPYSNPEPSQTSTWLCPTVNGCISAVARDAAVYRKKTASPAGCVRTSQAGTKLDRTQTAVKLLLIGMHAINCIMELPNTNK